MDVLGVEGDGAGIEVVLTTQGIKATNIRGEELGENPLPARLRGQDVDLSENNRRVALLGEIVQRFGNNLWRETRNRHQDLSKTTHRRSTLLQAGTSPRMRKIWDLPWSLRRTLHACHVSWQVNLCQKEICRTTWFIMPVRLRLPFVTLALSRRALICLAFGVVAMRRECVDTFNVAKLRSALIDGSRRFPSNGCR